MPGSGARPSALEEALAALVQTEKPFKVRQADRPRSPRSAASRYEREHFHFRATYSRASLSKAPRTCRSRPRRNLPGPDCSCVATTSPKALSLRRARAEDSGLLPRTTRCKAKSAQKGPKSWSEEDYEWAHLTQGGLRVRVKWPAFLAQNILRIACITIPLLIGKGLAV